MYNARVFEIFIASPSDVEIERNIVRKVIERWNVLNSKSMNIVLKTLGWEKDIFENHTVARAQDLVNEQILERADFLVGIFWTKVGSPTGGYESGTVEEIEKHVNTGKPSLLFFSNKPIATTSIDTNELDRVNKLKENFLGENCYNTFNSDENFEQKLFDSISKFFNDKKNVERLIKNISPEIEIAQSYDEEAKSHDLTLFHHLMTIFKEDSYQGDLEYVGNNGYYSKDVYNYLFEFAQEVQKPKTRFLNETLNNNLEDFKKNVAKLIHFMTYNFTPVAGNSECHKLNRFEYETDFKKQDELVGNAFDQLNEKIDGVFESFDFFRASVTRILKV